MNKNIAFTLINNYFKAWLEQDEKLFLSQLHNDVIVRECTGDVYNNKDIAEKWFKGWNREGNRVLRWDILNQYYNHDHQVAFVEWVFECMYEHNIYTFEGSSMIKFKDDLIVKIDEYQMDINKKYPYGKA